MPQFIVKTIHDRNLVIEADKYNFNSIENAYEFFAKDGEGLGLVKVATVPGSPEILAIVENDAEKADFYASYDWNEEDEEDDNEDGECDETCIDCRLGEFLECNELFDRVYNIIDGYHKYNQEDAPSCPRSETAPLQPEPSVPYPIEHWKTKEGEKWYGFWTTRGFVNFSVRDYAEEGRRHHISNPDQGWSYLDLTGGTRLED